MAAIVQPFDPSEKALDIKIKMLFFIFLLLLDASSFSFKLNISLYRTAVMGDNSLRIYHIATEDEGYYVCTAENSYGVNAMQALLTVTSKSPSNS